MINSAFSRRSIEYEGMILSNVTVKVTHIQCTASPPVNHTGDFNRLKIEAVLLTLIRESHT